MTLQILASILIRFFTTLEHSGDPVLKRAAGEARKQLCEARKFTVL